ncbi:hypothetical protein HJG54_15515 [Leptolyngbya sp. NK1-12]|uniref:RepB/MobA-like C-terminal domain-containing protein n=1 Tax=Leptolyngbya sp. NK1-12 TaxID=2547451 RepID=A0AA96WD80_9CYAN|nr:hypothetical protein [Leptolyngbya sp. NK1-12]WNZ24127.1 hypothetical protein HJG54_15515 [Leptolyngbya sp. NK1-12]
MWQKFSQDVGTGTPIKLDYLAGKKAFEAGYSQKEIALMLTLSSPYVAEIDETQGKQKALAYVNQTVRAVCRKVHEQEIAKGKQRQKELEL